MNVTQVLEGTLSPGKYYTALLLRLSLLFYSLRLNEANRVSPH
jgi:hypothetical protein